MVRKQAALTCGPKETLLETQGPNPGDDAKMSTKTPNPNTTLPLKQSF